MKLLESDGQAIEVLDREGVVALEPSLASAKEQDRRRHPLPDRRDRRLRPSSPAPWRPKSSRAAAPIHTGATITGLEAAGDTVEQDR